MTDLTPQDRALIFICMTAGQCAFRATPLVTPNGLALLIDKEDVTAFASAVELMCASSPRSARR